jgi:hypothetical protein
MFKLTQLIDFAKGADRGEALRLLNAAGNAPGVVRADILPTHEGVYHGGDVIWHVQFADEAAWRGWTGVQRAKLAALPGVIHVESVAYAGKPQGMRRPDLVNGAYRVALWCGSHNPTPERTAAFDTDVLAMPRHVGKILNWQLSRVVEASGKRQWTHIWEQEYQEISGLHVDYMNHPFHWGFVDRWFETQDDGWLIDPYVCHTYADLPASIMAAAG